MHCVSKYAIEVFYSVRICIDFCIALYYIYITIMYPYIYKTYDPFPTVKIFIKRVKGSTHKLSSSKNIRCWISDVNILERSLATCRVYAKGSKIYTSWSGWNNTRILYDTYYSFLISKYIIKIHWSHFQKPLFELFTLKNIKCENICWLLIWIGHWVAKFTIHRRSFGWNQLPYSRWQTLEYFLR